MLEFLRKEINHASEDATCHGKSLDRVNSAVAVGNTTVEAIEHTHRHNEQTWMIKNFFVYTFTKLEA